MQQPDNILTAKNIKFLPYNTGMPKMRLSEYGRNIQNVVDYCCEIPGENGSLDTFWDHLNIMSGFRLDIDFPVEVVTAEEMNVKPQKLPYPTSPMRARHYGRSLEAMIKIVADMEESAERDELISMCAHQMKKMLMAHNPEAVSDAKVLADLCEFSDGKINLDPSTYQLREFQDITPAKAKKGKKKKKEWQHL